MAAIQKDIEGVTEKIEGNSEHQQQKEVVLNPQPELQLDEEPRNKRAQVQHEEEDGQEDIVDYDELEGEEQDGYTDDDAGEIIYFDDDGEIDEEEGDVEWEDDEDEEDDVDDDEAPSGGYYYISQVVTWQIQSLIGVKVRCDAMSLFYPLTLTKFLSAADVVIDCVLPKPPIVGGASIAQRKTPVVIDDNKKKEGTSEAVVLCLERDYKCHQQQCSPRWVCDKHVQGSPHTNSFGTAFSEHQLVAGTPMRHSGFGPPISHGYVEVNLVAVRKPFECPICLGIMKETRTLQDCMHRFCRDCIEKEMGLGNNECPVCHVRIESRSSLREDIRYNKMILALFGEVEKNEEQAPVPDKDKSVRGKQTPVTPTDKILRDIRENVGHPPPPVTLRTEWNI
ncbi:hypothetical protein IFM89_003809 [Coptis chinensis]|uniref:RING-type domain-containing protein n=1 Tax=Coptis chinensis TaxID=261450 RepID=A0A835GYH9_9MAGN|nr:hypothetical protein IFM89_003809 [Coptis chinensis]